MLSSACSFDDDNVCPFLNGSVRPVGARHHLVVSGYGHTSLREFKFVSELSYVLSHSLSSLVVDKYFHVVSLFYMYVHESGMENYVKNP